MSKTGGDFSLQSYQPTLDLLKRNPPDKALAKELDTFMRTKNTAGPAFSKDEFPGFAAEGVWDVLDNAGGALRSKVMKALDRKSVIDAGGPDIGMIRVANANPDLYNTAARPYGLPHRQRRTRTDRACRAFGLSSCHPWLRCARLWRIGAGRTGAARPR
jgi:hypothetical protein